MDYRARRHQAYEQATALGVQASLITNSPDVRYLTGFSGSNAAVVLTSRATTLFTDGRYTTQAKQETRGVRIVIAKKSALVEACAATATPSIKACGFDADRTTVSQLDAMRRAIPASRRRTFFVKTPPLVARLRETKDPDEQAKIRRAAQLGCRLFENLLPHIQPGMRETEVAAHLEHSARTSGASAMSFSTIVAAGPRSALPHGEASTARIPAHGFVVLDFGVILDGYCSDMTRTVHVGRVQKNEQAAYEAVLEAQESAVAAVRAGVSCGDVDEAARSVLRRRKLARYFTHSTGHGVGIEIHEGPRIAAQQKQRLELGMIITIEPGIYIGGKFGIRIEDMVRVTEKGSEILTPATKALITL